METKHDNVPQEEPIDTTLAQSHGLNSDDAQRLANSHTEFLSQELQHPADVAEHLEALPLDEQVYLLSTLPIEDAADALAELDEHRQVDILEALNPDVAAGLLGEMSPDDAADVLDELDEEHSDSLLNKLETEDAQEIRELMSFDPDTAGGIMNTEIIILEKGLTADEAVVRLRSEIGDKEIPYYAYIVSGDDVLEGVLSLRDLIMLPPGMVLGKAIGNQDLITATFDETREEVARLISHYNFMALPVTDLQGRLLGVISHDDIIDVIQDLASEDMLGMVGAGQDETVDTPWFESVKMRLPWLLVNMVNSVVSASVVYLFEGSIEQMAILAVFMPMVGNQAGNTGQQALAVIIRQMAFDKIEGRKAVRAVTREAKICLLNGLFLGLLAFTGVSIFTWSMPSGGFMLAAVMASALVFDMLLGAIAGGSIPLILKRLGRDPAQASSIFLTAITDGAGFFVFLGLATLFLL